MTRIATIAAALTLSAAISTPAHAGLLSSPLGVVIDYAGDLADIDVGFKLTDTTNNQVLALVPVIVENQTTDKAFFTADLSAGGWLMDDDLEWCLVINATALDPVTEPIRMGFMIHQADDGNEVAVDDGTNFAGTVRELCTVGSSQ